MKKGDVIIYDPLKPLKELLKDIEKIKGKKNG